MSWKPTTTCVNSSLNCPSRSVAPCFHRVVNFRHRRVRKIAQRGEMTTARLVRTSLNTDPRPGTDRRIDNVGLLTLGAGIESPTRTGSDQTAAEALQEAETEVGTRVKVVREFGLSALPRSTNKVIDIGLLA